MSDFRTRRMVAEDLQLVRDAWRDSYRMSHMAGPIPMDMYREIYEQIIRRILERPDVEVHVMEARRYQPPENLIGWIAIERDAWTRRKVFDHALGEWVERDVQLEQPLIHYVYVKHSLRGQGIARALFRAAGVNPDRPWTHTFSTSVLVKMRARHADDRERQFWPGHFDPRLVRFPKKQLPKLEPTEE